MRFLNTSRCRRGLLVLGTTLLSVTVAAAGSVATDGTLGAAQAIAGPNYAITQAFGQIVGGNLFHSFGTFNIGTGETATFSSGTPVSNVIARVTGSASSIDGLIASTINGANLFLVNPRGISFGPNASLNIGGSFFASTADYLKLGTTGRFDASTPGNSVLTSAPPSAFGFVGQSPAPISFNGSFLSAPTGQSLSVVAGDISLTNVAILRARAGRVDLASIGSSGEVSLGATNITTSGVSHFGTITLNSSAVLVDTTAGLASGRVFIRGGQLILDNGSVIRSTNAAAAQGGDIQGTLDGTMSLDHSSVIQTSSLAAGNAGSINFQAGNLSLANGSEIYSSTSGSGQGGSVTITTTDSAAIFGADGGGNPSGIFTYTLGPGNAGNINLQLGALSLTNGGEIVAETFGAGQSGSVTISATGAVAISGAGSVGPSVVSTYSAANGNAGAVSLTAPDLSIGAGGQINAETDVSGQIGNINLQVGTLSLSSGGQILSTAFGAGQGGSVIINATSPISISGADSFGNRSGVQTLAASTGNAGSIAVAAPSMNLTGGGLIQSGTSGPGNAGSISVTVPSMSVDGGRIASLTVGPGNAGDINLQAGVLSLTNGGQVTANTFGAGQGGSIDVTATGSIDISGANSGNFSGIFVNSKNPGTGIAGSISVTAPSLRLDGGGIQSVTETIGYAGDINLQVGALSLINGSQIDVSTFGAGRGGSVTISATGPIAISGSDSSGRPSGVLASSSNPGTGNAGFISVTAPSLSLDGQGFIQSKTEGPGNAGGINLQVGTLSLTNGGQIAADTSGVGQGGSVTIAATGPVSVSGIGNSGQPSGMFANSNNTATGDAGFISITAPSLSLGSDGSIQSVTKGLGDAGNINLQLGALSLTGGSVINADTFGAGKGGSISVAATGAVSISGTDGSGNPSGVFVSSKGSATGNAGSISVATPSLSLNSGGLMQSKSEGSGAGGPISVSAGDILLSGGGSISAESHGTGNAGTLALNAANSLQLQNGAQITTEATHADGGNIQIHAGTLVYLRDSKITTSVGTGQGNGGNITIDPVFVVLQGSQISANAFGGNGGNINIITDNFFQSPDSGITASSQLGISGAVFISAPIVDFSGRLVTLLTPYLNIGNLLAERCAARLAGKASSFVIAGRGGLPVEPDGPLPSVAMTNSSPTGTERSGKAATIPLALNNFDFGCSK